MSASKEQRACSDLTDEELAGFVRLLLAGENLPKVTPEILAYLERARRQAGVEESSLATSAREGRTKTPRERLQASCPRPIRPLGTHLLAKRTEASCHLEEVAYLLREHAEQLRAIETRAVSPFDIGVQRLAKIAAVFGLYMSELRESLRLDVCEPRGDRRLGTSFARSHEDDFRSEVLRIASEDLSRASKTDSRYLEPPLGDSINGIVQAVGSLLRVEGLDKLVDD